MSVLGGFLVLAIAISTMTSVVSATPIWGTSPALAELTGERDSSAGGGLTASMGWAGGNFSVSWVITYDMPTELWTYQYTLDSMGGKSPSHTIIEVTEDELVPFEFEPGSSPLEDGANTFVPGHPSNPDLPNALYGVKHDYAEGDQDNGVMVTTIVTGNSPVWGVFYTKDGKTDRHDVTAWSNALNFADYKTNETLTATDFIVRPNGVDDPVIPEPATMSLLLIGGGAIVARRRRRA